MESSVDPDATQYQRARSVLELKVRQGLAKRDTARYLVEDLLQFDCPISKRYEHLDVIKILRDNCSTRNPGILVLIHGLVILEHYGKNLLRPDRPEQWRTILFSNSVFRLEVDVLKGSRELLRLLGYTVAIIDGLSYPDDIIIPDIPKVASVTADIWLLRHELLMVANGEHRLERQFYSYIPEADIHVAQGEYRKRITPISFPSHPMMNQPTDEAVSKGAGVKTAIETTADQEIGGNLSLDECSLTSPSRFTSESAEKTFLQSENLQETKTRPRAFTTDDYYLRKSKLGDETDSKPTTSKGIDDESESSMITVKSDDGTEAETGDKGQNAKHMQEDLRTVEVPVERSSDSGEISGSPSFTHKAKTKSLIRRAKPKSNVGSVCSGGTRSRKSRRSAGLVELREDVFWNKKAPLCEGAHVYKGEQRNGKGIPKIDLAIKIFYTEEEESSSESDSNSADDRREEPRMIEEKNESEKSSIWLKQYRHEVKHMVALNDHKHLTKFKFCGNIKGEKLSGLYIAMGLCHVTTLAHINLEKVAPDQRRNIFSQICHGLAFLHKDKESEKRVAHMDLKPSNILFSIDGRTAMLSDFGLSKEVDINKKGDKTIIKKSSTIHGGTQGWMAAEMLWGSDRGKPDFIKADIFSLGLVGIYILYNKHHPFADPKDKRDPALWHGKIKKEEDAMLEPLQDDHLVRDLFEKMLSQNPDERPSIQEVLQHSMFWDPTDQLTFLKEIFDHYFGNGKFEDKHKAQTDEKLIALKVAYVPLSTVRKNPLPKAITLASLNSAAEAEVVTEMTDVFGQCWLDRVEEMDKIKGTKVYKVADRKKTAYQDYSLSELLRYIRNHLSHALGLEEDRKRNGALHWVEAFPKLIPYLLEIIEPVLTLEDRKKFIQKWAEAGDIDLLHLLGDMP